MTYYTWLDTPAGTLLLIGNGVAVTGMHWKIFSRSPAVSPDWTEDPTVFEPVIRQLREYFAGERTTFDFTYHFAGTEFQNQVWQKLAAIPYGKKTSYQAIATAIGRPKAVRAVGTAVGSNPLSIVVPCHRVLTSVDTLGGYAGGLDGKRVLLQTEAISFTE